MKTKITTLVLTSILAVLPASGASAAEAPQEKAIKPVSDWVLNDQEYFEKPGLSVLVFHDIYPEGKQGGIEIIQHGERVAAVGDVRLEPAPGQWGELPIVGKRLVDRAANRAEVPLRFEKEGIEYRVRVEPDGDALYVTVDLARPLPAEFLGRAGFNLELFPTAYFGKSYHLGRTDGIFSRQGNGPCEKDGSVMRPAVLAEGPIFVAAPEDPLRRLTIESLSGNLRFIDGRSTQSHGWFLVRSLISAGATTGAVRWKITPNAVSGWRRPRSSGSHRSATTPNRTNAPSSNWIPARPPSARARFLKWTRKRVPCPFSSSRLSAGDVSSGTIMPVSILQPSGNRAST